MLKIIAVISIYNCSDVVLTALNSIDGKVDEIKIVDGRWIGHDGPDLSPDDTIAVVTEWSKTSKSKVSFYQFSPMHEWETRNEILKYIDNGDWIFTFDSDEIIVEWENVREELEYSVQRAYRIFWKLFKPFSALPNAKFFKKTETVHYDRNHREIFDEDGWIDVPRAPSIHIVIDHQPKSETKKDRKNMKEYYKRNAEYEQSERNNQSN